MRCILLGPFRPQAARTKSGSRCRSAGDRETRDLEDLPRPASKRQDAAFVIHDALDHGCGAHQALALRDKVALRLVEQFEIGGAGPEAGAMIVSFLDPVVDGLRV